MLAVRDVGGGWGGGGSSSEVQFELRTIVTFEWRDRIEICDSINTHHAFPSAARSRKSLASNGQ